MIREIEERYAIEKKEGREVYAIDISPIAYHHLLSELNNRNSSPEWTNLIRVKEDIRRFEIYSQPLASVGR